MQHWRYLCLWINRVKEFQHPKWRKSWKSLEHFNLTFLKCHVILWKILQHFGLTSFKWNFVKLQSSSIFSFKNSPKTPRKKKPLAKMSNNLKTWHYVFIGFNETWGSTQNDVLSNPKVFRRLICWVLIAFFSDRIFKLVTNLLTNNSYFSLFVRLPLVELFEDCPDLCERTAPMMKNQLFVKIFNPAKTRCFVLCVAIELLNITSSVITM